MGAVDLAGLLIFCCVFLYLDATAFVHLRQIQWEANFFPSRMSKLVLHTKHGSTTDVGSSSSVFFFGLALLVFCCVPKINSDTNKFSIVPRVHGFATVSGFNALLSFALDEYPLLITFRDPHFLL